MKIEEHYCLGPHGDPNRPGATLTFQVPKFIYFETLKSMDVAQNTDLEDFLNGLEDKEEEVVE